MALDTHERLVLVGWLDRIRNTLTDTTIERLHNTYKRKDPNIQRVNVDAQKRYVGEAYLLLEAVSTQKANEVEVYGCMAHLLMCLDSEKYDLDIKRYKADYHDFLEAVTEKYLKKRGANNV